MPDFREIVFHVMVNPKPAVLDHVHTMPAHLKNNEKCDSLKFRASVHTLLEQFENGKKFCFLTVRNLTVESSFQDSDAKEMHIHSNNRAVSFQKRRKICSISIISSVHMMPFLK